jgi:hypothetical protein
MSRPAGSRGATLLASVGVALAGVAVVGAVMGLAWLAIR